VRERRPWPGNDAARARVVSEHRAPGDGAEGEDDAHVGEERQLVVEEVGAAGDLVGARRVVGRSAADGGDDVSVRERQAVVARGARGLAGEAGAMERGEEEVARAIPGEDTPGAVRAVRGGRETENRDPRPRVAEPGDRSPPVPLAGIRGALLARNLLPPGDQPRAAPAALDLLGQRRERSVA